MFIHRRRWLGDAVSTFLCTIRRLAPNFGLRVGGYFMSQALGIVLFLLAGLDIVLATYRA